MRQEVDILQGEMRNLKTPSFDGEREREDDFEAWLLGIRKYFQLHNYSSNLHLEFSHTLCMEKLLCGGIS